MKASLTFAKLVSYLFHPLLIPTMGLFLIFHISEAGLWVPTAKAQWILYGITFCATFLLPLITALGLLNAKRIDSLEMQTKEERRIPYFTTAIFYSGESYLLMQLDIPALVKALLLGATTLVISAMLINIFWKISAHMVGIGGLCGMMMAVSSRLQTNLHLTIIALFLIAGLVAYSRLKLNAHDSTQVYAGFLLGVTVQLILFL